MGCVTFASEQERLHTAFRTHLEQFLAGSHNLWKAGLAKDGIASRSARPFPQLGSLSHVDPQLETMVAALIRANIEEQVRRATGSMSMGPANARRVSSRGVFDHDSVELMLSEWLSRASGTEDVA